MKNQLGLNSPHSPSCIHGKPVLNVATRILNPDSDFRTKRLCDKMTFSSGSSCVFTCSYCYVESMMHRGGSAVAQALERTNQQFSEVVIRRNDPVARLQNELDGLSDRKRHTRSVIFASPAVDVAATLPLANETTQLCNLILSQTEWDIRLLSKSPLIRRIAQSIPSRFKERMIYGLSTGTLDDTVAKAIEPDAPLPSLRLKALKQLQDEGFRTFAMLCPILPQNLVSYATKAARLIDFSRVENVWAEVLNRRGESMDRTQAALESAKLDAWADHLRQVFGEGSTQAWEVYARSTFSALTTVIPADKLLFLQYVRSDSLAWWEGQRISGAICLGEVAKKRLSAENNRSADTSVLDGSCSPTPAAATESDPPLLLKIQTNLSPAQKAWVTRRKKYTPEQLKNMHVQAAKKAQQTKRLRKEGWN